jgi:hypothetical protein
MIRIVFILLFCISCTNYILQETTEYHSITLNGNAWIQLQNSENNSLDHDRFTIEFWFTGGNSSNTESASLISIIDESGNIKFGIFKDPLNPNSLEIWLNNERREPLTLTLDPNLNKNDKFHHIAITSGENIFFYVNGERVKKMLGDNIDIENNDIVFGGKVNQDFSVMSNFWVGNFDEVRFWSTTLSNSQIGFHVENPSKIAESFSDEYVSNLEGLWRFQFSEGDSSPLIEDESCGILTQIYTTTSSSCNADNDLTIYTIDSGTTRFSTKSP